MEISKIENSKAIENFNYIKIWLFENISKIDKPLPNLTKKRQQTKINKIKNERDTLTQIMKKLKQL